MNNAENNYEMGFKCIFETSIFWSNVENVRTITAAYNKRGQADKFLRCSFVLKEPSISPSLLVLCLKLNLAMEMRPNKSEELCLSLGYNRFYDVFDEG